MKIQPAALNLISATLLFLFFYAGIKKLANKEQFEDVIRQSSILRGHASWLVWVIPVTELIVAVLLFLYATRLAGLYTAALLLLIYSIYLGWMLLFAAHLPCSCGGITKEMSWHGQLFFNAVVFLITLTAILLFHKYTYRRKRAPPSQKDLPQRL